jgi:hypothetical protein
MSHVFTFSVADPETRPWIVRSYATAVREYDEAATHVLVGPTFVGPDMRDENVERLFVKVAVGTAGGPGKNLAFDFGEPEEDRLHDVLAAAAARVRLLRRPGRVTKAEVDAGRLLMIEELRKLFASIEVHDTHLALAEAIARLFPSDRARFMVNLCRAEMAGALQVPPQSELPF